MESAEGNGGGGGRGRGGVGGNGGSHDRKIRLVEMVVDEIGITMSE